MENQKEIKVTIEKSPNASLQKKVRKFFLVIKLVIMSLSTILIFFRVGIDAVDGGDTADNLVVSLIALFFIYALLHIIQMAVCGIIGGIAEIFEKND